MATAAAVAKLSSVMLHPLFSHQSPYKQAAATGGCATHPVESVVRSVCFVAGVMWFRGDTERQL